MRPTALTVTGGLPFHHLARHVHLDSLPLPDYHILPSRYRLLVVAHMVRPLFHLHLLDFVLSGLHHRCHNILAVGGILDSAVAIVLALEEDHRDQLVSGFDYCILGRSRYHNRRSHIQDRRKVQRIGPVGEGNSAVVNMVALGLVHKTVLEVVLRDRYRDAGALGSSLDRTPC